MEEGQQIHFEGISSMLQDIEHQMKQLEAENQRLQQQLTALRQGIGIVVVIEGTSLALTSETRRDEPPTSVPLTQPYEPQHQEIQEESTSRGTEHERFSPLSGREPPVWAAHPFSADKQVSPIRRGSSLSTPWWNQPPASDLQSDRFEPEA